MKYIAKLKFLPFYTLSIMPLFVLYRISDLAYVVLYYLIRYRRDVVSDNLKNSFPLKSELEIKAIEKKFYRHFCDIWIEAIKVLTISKKEVKKRIHIRDLELIQKLFDEKRSVIFYTAHQGNWEWLAFLPLYIPYQVTSFYQSQSSKYFDELLITIRERFGTICNKSNEGYRSLISFKQKNIQTLTLMVGDQSPGKNSSKYWTQFLNQETAFLQGASTIARKTNQVVIFSYFLKRCRGYYELNFKLLEKESIEKSDNEIIAKYAKSLETTIESSPELWLWSHKRWKLSRE